MAVCVHDLEIYYEYGPLVKPWLGMHTSVRSLGGYCFGGMFSSHCEGFISVVCFY